MDKFRQVVAQLPPEPPRPDAPSLDGNPDALISEALAALQEHDTQAGRVAHERDATIHEQEPASRSQLIDVGAIEKFPREIDQLFIEAESDAEPELLVGRNDPEAF